MNRSFGRRVRPASDASNHGSGSQPPIATVTLTFDVLCSFLPPFIGSEWVRGVESTSREHAVMQAQAEVSRRRLPPSWFSARLVDEDRYYPPAEVCTDWALFGEAPVRKAMEIEHV